MPKKMPERSTGRSGAERAKRLRLEWLRKNRGALRAYNAHIEKQGVFSEGLRSF